jgi:transposase
VRQVIHSDVHNVALNNDLSDAEVWSMLKYIAEQTIVIDFKQLKRLGVDEISLRKGMGNFIVILVDLDTMKPIGFVKSRKQKDIEEVLIGWGQEVLEQIVEVSMDMSGNYKGLVQTLLPNADITVDRFHVMKLVNEELDEARRQQRNWKMSQSAREFYRV